MRNSILALTISVTMGTGANFDLLTASMVAYGPKLPGYTTPNCQTMIFTLGPTFCVRESMDEIRRMLRD